jgi:hypothetical protein
VPCSGHNYRPSLQIAVCPLERRGREVCLAGCLGFEPRVVPSYRLSAFATRGEVTLAEATLVSHWQHKCLPGTLQVFKKFPIFSWARSFTTVFTTACHLSLSWARLIRSTLSYPISLRSTSILFSHLRLGLTSGLFPAGFTTRNLNAFLSHLHVPHAPPILSPLFNHSRLLIMQFSSSLSLLPPS